MAVSNLGSRRSPSGKWFGLVLTIIGVGGLGFGLWLIGTTWLEKSNWSRLESAQVQGLERLSKNDVLRAANLTAGLNIMHLPLDSIAWRVERVPGVRNARVIRKIPHRVLIRIEERKAIACLFRGRIWLVDEDGVLYPTLGPGEVIDVPVLTGEIDPDPRRGTGFRQAIAFVAKVKEAYPTVYGHLGEVTVQGGRIGFRLKEGGANVLAGDPTSSATLVKLEQFLIQRSGELTSRSQYLDLRYPAMIVAGTDG
jgi:cell division protein FtsQ